MGTYENKPKKNKKSGWVILLLLSVLLVIGAVVFAVIKFTDMYRSEYIDLSQYKNNTATVPGISKPQNSGEFTAPDATEPGNEGEQEGENPINFEALAQVNPDIYAWIYIPNTGIDLPILQAGENHDDSYYLHRNMYGNYEYKGCIFTEKANSKDFTDPVTIIYGHNMLDDTMFSNLSLYRTEQFFDDNPYFYIYTPGHVLTYEIVSAHQYDKRHILHTYDFSKEADFQAYIDYFLNPRTMVCDIREGASVTTDDRIVTLSTCMNYGTARYLIQGVLISDEPTR